MTTYKPNRRLTLIALMFIIGAIFFAGTTAYAAAEPPPDTLIIVKEVWLTGDTLHVSVSDGSEGQIIELNLREYAKPGDEYVTIQATDEDGRKSNAITFKNPYYQPGKEPPEDSGENVTDKQSESAVPGDAKPFTPDGTGTVVDNASDGDGKEFFTVETPDGNVFYLIVDRQRNTDNVYLLNAVTEDDLASLAKPGDGKSVSAVATPPPPVMPVQPETTPEPTLVPEPAPEKSGNTGTLAFIGIAALAIGGAAYYFKFVRPKKGGADMSYPDPEDYEDEDMDVEDDDEDEDGEDV